MPGTLLDLNSLTYLASFCSKTLLHIDAAKHILAVLQCFAVNLLQNDALFVTGQSYERVKVS